MKIINSIRDIDLDIPEGKLLMLAIGWLMTMEGNTTKTPDDIVADLNDRTVFMKEEVEKTKYFFIQKLSASFLTLEFKNCTHIMEV